MKKVQISILTFHLTTRKAYYFNGLAASKLLRKQETFEKCWAHSPQ